MAAKLKKILIISKQYFCEIVPKISSGKFWKEKAREAVVIVRYAARHPKKFCLAVFENETKISIAKKATIALLIIFSLWAIFQIPRWYKEFKYRTHFEASQKKISGISEEEAGKRLGEGENCQEIRKNSERLFSTRELEEAVAGAGAEKLVLAGKDEPGGAGAGQGFGADGEVKRKILLDISGKDIELKCFDFADSLSVFGDGKIEISHSSFQKTHGNGLSLNGGAGKIFRNIFEENDKAGIFVESGQWEISENLIKENLSYGIYAGFGADVRLRANAILENGGYEVRLMKEREVFK